MRWRDPDGRVPRSVGWFALACIALFAVLNLKPNFSNASLPPRGIASPLVALGVARDVGEVDAIIGEAPSPDREAMRLKQYLDFVFLACYIGLYSALAAMFRSPVAIAAAACGIAAGVCGVFENLGILRILNLPLRQITQTMVDSIRHPSLAKWALAFVATALFGSLFYGRPGWLSRAIGAANLLAAAIGGVGLFQNAFLVWAGLPILAGLAGLVTLSFLFR